MKQFLFKGLEGQPKPYKLAVFDIEGNNWKDFVMMGFYDGQEYYEFFKVQDFLDFVLTRKYFSWRIFAHFGGRYDFLFILEYLFKIGFHKQTQIIEVSGRIILLKVKIKDRNIYFVDSFSLLPSSLDKLGEAFQTKHRKVKGYDVTRNDKKVTAELREYQRMDCLSLFEILDKFQVELNSLGANMRITIASTAMDLFRRKYFKIQIPTHYRIESEIRQGYFGGRVEVFKKYFRSGPENKYLFYYDYNSLYPSVMLENYYPVGNAITVKDYKFNPNHLGFAFLEANIPKSVYIPPIPIQGEDHLLYMTGKIKGIYPLIYVKILEELNIPYKIEKAYLFEKAKLFHNYVKDLYGKRIENKNNVKNYIFKLLLNSLYGKFGQNRIKKEYICNPDKDDLLNKVLYPYNLDFDLWYEEKESYALHILPAVAAYVTAYAHEKLYKALFSLDNAVYYCDTDSLVTTQEIETSDKLGELKIEHKIIEAIFLNPKLYGFIDDQGKEHIKAKGFKVWDPNKKDFKLITFNSFKKALFKNDRSDFNQEYEKLFGFRSALNAKNNIDNSFLFVGSQKKSLKIIANKREFNYFSSVPFNKA